MLFETYMAFSLTLLALVAGTFLLGSLDKLTPCCKTMGKVVGYLTVALSVIQLACASYHTVKYWDDGVYKCSIQGQKSGMDGRDKMMMHQMMMQKMMGDGMGPGKGMGPANGMGPGKGPKMPGQVPGEAPGDDHEAHHPAEP